MMWGGYQILTRLSQRTDSPDTTLVWSAFAAFAATTLAAPWGWQWPDAQGWALMIVAALLGAIANYALIRALDYAEASAVQPYSYTLLVWVTILGAVVFGDIPDHWTIAGALLIVASGLYSWHHDRRMNEKKPSSRPKPSEARRSGGTSSCMRAERRGPSTPLRSGRDDGVRCQSSSDPGTSAGPARTT